MSLPQTASQKIPLVTARIARKACRHSPWVALRDQLGPLFCDADFASLFSQTGQPALAPWRLALVSLLQFAEDLSDRQAADAVGTRLDWKYLLALELDADGFDHSVLSEFRHPLVADDSALLFLERVLELATQRKLFHPQGAPRTDATHVLARVRSLNRLELITTTFQHALNVLAGCAPEWVLAQVPEVWAESYGAPLTEFRLPKKVAERTALAVQIGADGDLLLASLWSHSTPAWMRAVPAVEALRRISRATIRLAREPLCVARSGCRRLAALRPRTALAPRSGSALRREARRGLDRLQDSSDRNL